MAKTSYSSLFKSSTRPIEPFTKAKIQAATKPIEKSSHTYKAKMTGKKIEKKNTITNSYTKKSKQKYSPGYFKTKHATIDKVMKYNMNMSYGDSKRNTEMYFDRLYSVYLDLELDNVCQYVFIVRPDMNIYKENSTTQLATLTSAQINAGYYPNSYPAVDQFFKYMKASYPKILQHLTPELSGDHDFMSYLVGRTESLQIPDYSIKSYKMNQPYTNYNLPYASHALESTTGGSFDITFREDADLKIHKLFQTWLYYINGVTRNMFGPKMKHIRHNKIDYATSVYCITCKADAETIIYWTKYTGAFPTTVPNSDMSFNLRGSVNNKITIPFEYFLQEAMDPYILVDFNKNAHVVKSNSQGYIPVYHSQTLKTAGFETVKKEFDKTASKTISKHMTNSTVNMNMSAPIMFGSGNGLVGAPYIYKDKSTKLYKLRWKKLGSNISGKK